MYTPAENTLPGKRRSGNSLQHEIECLGRGDRQVKLRGYRIELGEIEAALSAHPEVVEAAVVIRGERAEDQRLVAYLVGRTSRGVKSGELQDYLGRTLPEYMVPSLFLWLEKLPKTMSGKTDLKALPESDQLSDGDGQTYSQPLTAVEKSVASIWANVLGLDRVGLDDSFFRLGGHSLTSIQLISRINRQFCVNLPVRALFENPTHINTDFRGERLPG